MDIVGYLPSDYDRRYRGGSHGQQAAREDHGMDSCALFHAYRGYHLLSVFRSEHPKGEGYQRAKYGLAYETFHAGVRRAGKPAYPSPQPPPDETLHQPELGFAIQGQ